MKDSVRKAIHAKKKTYQNSHVYQFYNAIPSEKYLNKDYWENDDATKDDFIKAQSAGIIDKKHKWHNTQIKKR
jgi:hypothetical protein